MDIYALYLAISNSTQTVDPLLALSVAQVESNLKEKAIGSAGEVGLFQIKPKYSFLSKKDLLKADKNIKEGIRMLEQAKEKCKHQIDNTWLICYNLGVNGAKRIVDPKRQSYYRRIMNDYKRRLIKNNPRRERLFSEMYARGREGKQKHKRVLREKWHYVCFSAILRRKTTKAYLCRA